MDEIRPGAWQAWLQERQGDAVAAMALRKQALDMGREATANSLRVLEREAQELKARIAEEQEGDTTPVDLWYQYDALIDKVEEAKDSLYSLVSLALDGRYTAEDIKGWCSRAVEMGCTHPQIGASLLEDLLYVRRIPNEPFRKHLAAQESGSILVEHDKEMGDIRKMVGLRSTTNGRGAPTLRMFITYEQGVELAQRFGMTPQAAGI